VVGYLEVQDYTTVEHVRPIIPHLWPQIKGGGENGGFTFQKIGPVTVEKFFFYFLKEVLSMIVNDSSSFFTLSD
jgi:hypothetical protein